MGPGLLDFEMFIHGALEICIQLGSTIEAGGGLDILRVEAEPDACMAVADL